MSQNYILDTHCLIWFQEDNPKIPSRVMEKIQEPSNTVFFSQISLFEITIKQKIGKLPEFTADISEVYHQAISDNCAGSQAPAWELIAGSSSLLNSMDEIQTAPGLWQKGGKLELPLPDSQTGAWEPAQSAQTFFTHHEGHEVNCFSS